MTRGSLAAPLCGRLERIAGFRAARGATDRRIECILRPVCDSVFASFCAGGQARPPAIACPASAMPCDTFVGSFATVPATAPPRSNVGRRDRRPARRLRRLATRRPTDVCDFACAREACRSAFSASQPSYSGAPPLGDVLPRWCSRYRFKPVQHARSCRVPTARTTGASSQPKWLGRTSHVQRIRVRSP